MNQNVSVKTCLEFVRRHFTSEVLRNMTKKLSGCEVITLAEFTTMLNQEKVACEVPQPSPTVVRFTSHNADDSLTPKMEKILLELRGS